MKGIAKFKQPSIVLVPGCFATKEFYQSVISSLLAYSHNVEFAALSSIVSRNISEQDKPSAATLEDDISCIRVILTRLANGGKDVLLVAHGYGAFPANEACRSLSKLDRMAQGRTGGVIGLLYITGFIPSVGQSLAELVAEMDEKPAGSTMILDVSKVQFLNNGDQKKLINY